MSSSISYHELFSKDYWFLDFLEWRDKEKLTVNIEEDWWFKYTIIRHPYMEMADLKWYDKIKFVLNNAIVPLSLK